MQVWALLAEAPCDPEKPVNSLDRSQTCNQRHELRVRRDTKLPAQAGPPALPFVRVDRERSEIEPKRYDLKAIARGHVQCNQLVPDFGADGDQHVGVSGQ